ncbi:MAG TPA: hypothetical protein VFR58_13840 [Flavisolibacter sp.]|nr:hypothetical protein [Flavisolibacter sp.]
MKRIRTDAWVIILVFAGSRIIYQLSGLDFQYDALYKYWQYLDVDTLQHNLLRGVWYNHAQPPLFNLFLGAVLKLAGGAAPAVLALFFKLVTLAIGFLVYLILRRLVKHPRLPLVLALFYLLSPASMVFENELFYTTFISLLLMISTYMLLSLGENPGWKRAAGFFLPLVLICLTRSMYHLAWIFLVALMVLFFYRRRRGLHKLAVTGAVAFLMVGGWYVKNYFMFGEFSTSSWIGMNLARNVFHDAVVTDSSKIESIEPFSPITVYRPFITGRYERQFAGKNDADLLSPLKNDSLRNLSHISYLEVSALYLAACKEHAKAQPLGYAKNVVQSSIIFFAPATRYPVIEAQAAKIRYYDLLYSFNLSHFAKGKTARRIALTVSALPKFLLYCLVFFAIGKAMYKKQRPELVNRFLVAVILYVFLLSSLLEHYENMRFRFEIEPLFLLLLGQAWDGFLAARRARKEEKAKPEAIPAGLG